MPFTSLLPSLVLVCPSNCGSGTFTLMHRGQALANVFALKIFFVFFQQAAVERIVVDRTRQRGAKSDQVGAAFDGVDVVGEGEHAFRVAVVPLHGDLDADAVFLAFEVNDFCVDRGLGAIEMLDKGQQAAFVEKFVFFLRALVFDGDLDAAIEKRQLAQTLRQDIEAKIRGFKNLWCRV